MCNSAEKYIILRLFYKTDNSTVESPNKVKLGIAVQKLVNANTGLKC